MKKTNKLSIIIMLFSTNTFAYDANIYDNYETGKTTVEIIDDCGIVHRHTFDIKEIEKAVKWQNKLFETSKFCNKFIDNDNKLSDNEKKE